MFVEVQNLVATSPLILPLLFMIIAAPIGAIDVFYFHVIKLKLYSQPSSKAETVTHIIRSLVFGSGALLLLSFDIRGWWIWPVGALFILDFINTVVDVLLEPKSRKPLGGIPPAEYFIHIIGATAAGAITIAYFIQAWPLLNSAAKFEGQLGHLPWWVLVPGFGLVVGSLLFGILEVFLLFQNWSSDITTN